MDKPKDWKKNWVSGRSTLTVLFRVMTRNLPDAAFSGFSEKTESALIFKRATKFSSTRRTALRSNDALGTMSLDMILHKTFQ